ncbi:MAG: 2-succinyl-5-enolpyruvyl-6-hydroxy-3-cyclohexene-1-carboxylic-acid synthase [Thermoleophilaceae bacterium]|nr:2-succinyl-5-enolpyruvyl-6-hydroxy-3-cyclohexene-1-carboxylic-acid synthase [Thermoleophilaceae bacterium]
MQQIIPINPTYAPIQALVDELVRCGMRHAVTSPGSRNAPLALTLASRSELDCVSVIDERAAGFMALGMAKSSGRPVSVTCTSGTAAANLAPAVHEAWQARVALIVLTADRPPELREVGAGQAIDQVHLYGSAAAWFVEVGNHETGRRTAEHFRALGCRAFWTAAGGRPGPVHLNFSLRDPLDPAVADMDVAEWAGRDGGLPWTHMREHPPAPDANDVQRLAARMAEAPRGVIVCGPVGGEVAEPVARLAEQSGWPVLAEPASGVRCGEHDRSHVVAGYDVLLRDESFASSHAPDLVLRLGDTPTSKPLRVWLAAVPQVVLDPHGAWHEPTRMAELMLHAEPASACDALATALEMRAGPPPGPWLEEWRLADALVAPALAQAPEPSEPRAYVAAAPALEPKTLVWTASSMPVRDVEAFWPAGQKRTRFLANRGANGIDGTIASAAGASRATGAPTLVLIGELALLHDIGGLLAARRAGIALTVLCVDNGGGGIFDFLPVADSADSSAYENHVATPSGLDLEALSALAAMAYRPVSTDAEIRAAVEAGPGLIHVRTDRAANVGVHREIAERVATGLAGS